MALVLTNRDLPFTHILDSKGEGSGAKNVINNYSEIPSFFFLKPARNVTLSVISLTVNVSSVYKLRFHLYTPDNKLEKGISLSVRKGNEILVDFPVIHQLADWASLATDWKMSENFFQATINFPNIYGKSVMLYGSQDESLEIMVNDEIKGLLYHTYIARGYYRVKK